MTDSVSSCYRLAGAVPGASFFGRCISGLFAVGEYRAAARPGRLLVPTSLQLSDLIVLHNGGFFCVSSAVLKPLDFSNDLSHLAGKHESVELCPSFGQLTQLLYKRTLVACQGCLSSMYSLIIFSIGMRVPFLR